MILEDFLRLWTHRYHKLMHILYAHWKGCLAWMHFIAIKLRLEKGRPLIGIVRTEHFGDIIAVEPVSRYVREKYPNAYIVWFSKPAYVELLSGNPQIDEIYLEFCVTERKVVKMTGVFDGFYELQFTSNNYCPKCQMFTQNHIANEQGIDIFTYYNYGNLLEVFCFSAGIMKKGERFQGDDQPRVYLNEAHRNTVDQLGLNKPFIVLHCQSSQVLRDWPVDRWEMLVEWISQNYQVEIVEVGLKSNLNVTTAAYRNLCGQLSFLETAEVIRRATYFIGLDSGPAHLANATGTFGIILLGSLQTFSTYCPYSGSFGSQENAVIIRREGFPCSELSFEMVRDEVKKVFDRHEQKFLDDSRPNPISAQK